MHGLQQVELFVIQRCWFSGPNHEPSVDCRRLFTSRREAEEVAYHSAHAYANRSIAVNNRTDSCATRQQLNASVRTILLPHPPSTIGGHPSSSHAFQTCGKLFWVRSLKASIVPAVATSQSAGLTYPVPAPTLACAATSNSSFPFTSAEVILTENIIGGTGNPNSRRGSEIAEGRVVVSTDPSHANRRAVEAARQLHLSMAHNPHVTMSVLCVPIGKAHLGQNTHDWPEAPSVVNGHYYHQQQWNNNNNTSMIMDDAHAMVKRDWGEQQQQQQHSYENHDPRIHQQQQQQCGSRPAKRQCHAASFSRQQSPHKQEAASDVPCSMMFG